MTSNACPYAFDLMEARRSALLEHWGPKSQVKAEGGHLFHFSLRIYCPAAGNTSSLKHKPVVTHLLLRRRSLAAVFISVSSILTRQDASTHHTKKRRRQWCTKQNPVQKRQNSSILTYFNEASSNLLLLPLIEIHHDASQIRDQVLLYQVDGWKLLFWRRRDRFLQLLVQLVDVGQFLDGRQTASVKMVFFVYLPWKCWDGVCAHLHQLDVDQLLRTRCSLHEGFT